MATISPKRGFSVVTVAKGWPALFFQEFCRLYTEKNWMLKSKGRPVQGQISSKYYKIHLRGVVKVSVFIKATLFGRTYRYPRAMFCSQWLFVRHPYGDLYLLFVRESVHFFGFFCDC